MPSRSDFYDLSSTTSNRVVNKTKPQFSFSGSRVEHRPVVFNRTTSANLPDWKQRIKDGRDATTTLYGTRYTLKQHHSGYWHAHYNGGNVVEERTGQIMQGDINFAPGMCEVTTINHAKTISSAAFVRKFRKRSRDFSGGVFAGELLEAARMLANPARGVRKAVDVLHDKMKGVHKASKDARTLTRAVSETWLEWHFGVKPLISDLDGAAKAFRHLSNGDRFDIHRFTGYGEHSDRVPTMSGVTFHNPGPNMVAGADCSFNYETVDTAEVTTRGAWRSNTPSGQMPIPAMFGVGLSDVVPTAWELVPWSFFADYFINVGEVLDAWSMRFVNFAWLNQTVRSRRQTTYSDLMIKTTPTFNFQGSGGHAVFTRYDVSRLPIDSGDLAQDFYVTIPGFPGSKKWLNVSALLAMKLKPR